MEKWSGTKRSKTLKRKSCEILPCGSCRNAAEGDISGSILTGKATQFHCRFHGETHADDFNADQGWIVKFKRLHKAEPSSERVWTEEPEDEPDNTQPSGELRHACLLLFSRWSGYPGIAERHSNEPGHSALTKEEIQDESIPEEEEGDKLITDEPAAASHGEA